MIFLSFFWCVVLQPLLLSVCCMCYCFCEVCVDSSPASRSHWRLCRHFRWPGLSRKSCAERTRARTPIGRWGGVVEAFKPGRSGSCNGGFVVILLGAHSWMSQCVPQLVKILFATQWGQPLPVNESRPRRMKYIELCVDVAANSH